MAEIHKTAIVIESGMVVGVYSTLPLDEHEVEVLDLDVNDNPDAADEIEAQVEKIEADPNYHKTLE